jgi:hypothetical protein
MCGGPCATRISVASKAVEKTTERVDRSGPWGDIKDLLLGYIFFLLYHTFLLLFTKTFLNELHGLRLSSSSQDTERAGEPAHV